MKILLTVLGFIVTIGCSEYAPYVQSKEDAEWHRKHSEWLEETNAWNEEQKLLQEERARKLKFIGREIRRMYEHPEEYKFCYMNDEERQELIKKLERLKIKP